MMSPHNLGPVQEAAPEGETFGMTDLEEALRGQDGAAVRRGVIARLHDLDVAVAAALREGAPPEQYAALQKLSSALAAASTLMIKLRDSSS